MSLKTSTRKGSVADSTYHTAVLTGIIIGGAVFLAGFVLCILGLTGAVEFIIEAEGFSAKLANASPGVVFALFGLALIWKYKPKIAQQSFSKSMTEEPSKPQESINKDYPEESFSQMDLESLTKIMTEKCGREISVEDIKQFLKRIDIDSMRKEVTTYEYSCKSSSAGRQ